jgi:hypothetical protein
MITEIETESESNQTKVTATMASLRQIINEQEQVLLENIRNVEKDQKKTVEVYKCRLQGEQQSLIEQVFNFVDVSKDKQPKKLLDAKQPFENYMKQTDSNLLELRPLRRTKNYIPGLEKIKEMEAQIRNISLVPVPKHENQQLKQLIANSLDKSTLNLPSLQLTDLDMEIIAYELEINKVKEDYFLLAFRLLACHKRKMFQRATLIVYQVFSFFFENIAPKNTQYEIGSLLIRSTADAGKQDGHHECLEKFISWKDQI